MVTVLSNDVATVCVSFAAVSATLATVDCLVAVVSRSFFFE